MRFYIFYICCFFSLSVNAQRYSISGKVTTAEDGKGIFSSAVCIPSIQHCVTTDEKGNFILRNISPGTYRLVVSSLEFDSADATIVLVNKNVKIDFSLSSHISQLDSVNVIGSGKTFGITRLKDVDGSGIYAGKKSEVIVVKDITANTATNNARQIYSKVAGLNIYENDGGAGTQLAVG